MGLTFCSYWDFAQPPSLPDDSGTEDPDLTTTTMARKGTALGVSSALGMALGLQSLAQVCCLRLARVGWSFRVLGPFWSRLQLAGTAAERQARS